MSFKEILLHAKNGEAFAFQQLLGMYGPLLVKEASDEGIFDEDLYQELCLTLFDCVRRFNF